jgi:hypothetical protein
MSEKCEYCGSRCSDARGNCGACGAPLPIIKAPWYDNMQPWNISVARDTDGGLVFVDVNDQRFHAYFPETMASTTYNPSMVTIS